MFKVKVQQQHHAMLQGTFKLNACACIAPLSSLRCGMSEWRNGVLTLPDDAS